MYVIFFGWSVPPDSLPPVLKETLGESGRCIDALKKRRVVLKKRGRVLEKNGRVLKKPCLVWGARGGPLFQKGGWLFKKGGGGFSRSLWKPLRSSTSLPPTLSVSLCKLLCLKIRQDLVDFVAF